MGREHGGRGLGVFKFVAVQQCLLMLFFTSCIPSLALVPNPGVLEYREPLKVVIPGGRVDVAGGNLVVERVDLSLDSLFGTLALGAFYNSANRSWIRSFEMSYDGFVFVDESGARHRVSQLGDDSPVPGTHWDRVDATRMRTRGGLLYTFDPFSHRLVAISWGDEPRPALIFFPEVVAGEIRNTMVAQCRNDGKCRLVYSIEYDDRGCVVGLEDRAGRRALYENDEWCRPLVARDALDLAEGWPGFRYTYHEGLLTGVMNSEGETIEYEYLRGRLVAVRRPASDESSMRLQYGFSGPRDLHYTIFTNGVGGRSIYRYDGNARLHEFESALGDTRLWTWEGFRPLSRTDAFGATTHWEYQNDELVRVDLPSGNTISTEYATRAENRNRPLAKPLRRVVDSMGLVEERTYDARGRLSGIRNGVGEERLFGHGSEGTLQMVIEPEGAILRLEEYGEHGHAEFISRSGWVASRTFDAVGNLLTGPDLAGGLAPGRPGIRSREFDEDRNLLRVQLEGDHPFEPFVAESAPLEFSYRSDGRPLEIARPYGGDARFDYDAMGRLTSRSERVDGIWWPTTYEYGPGGRLVATELPNGMRGEMSYDIAGHPISLSWLRDGVLEKSVSLEWEGSRLRSLNDTSRPGPEVYSHDLAGNLISVLYPEGEVLDRSYDLRSRVVSQFYRPGPDEESLTRVDYDYDLADRLLELRQDGGAAVSWHFELGRLAGMQYGNGLNRSFVYDRETGLLRSSRLEGRDSIAIESTLIDWSECHATAYCLTSSTSVEPTAEGGVPSLFSQEGYRMGPRPSLMASGSRVESWAPYAMNAMQSYGEEDYRFDVLGNWMGADSDFGVVSGFAFNPERNRLLGSDTGDHHDYEWDEAGFMVARDAVPIRWDAMGRIGGIGSDRVLEWDALGRLISTSHAGQLSRSLFGGTVSGDAERQAKFLDLGDVRIDLAGGEHLYRHNDLRGNVQMVTNRDGDLVKFYTYSPFGVSETYGTSPDTRSFSGGEELGDFLALGNRLYDSETGRFISPDPIFHPLNQYAYTLGNPVMLWDPNGDHATPSPAATAALGARDLAGKSESVGLVVLGVGLTLKSVSLVGLGVGFLFLSLVSGVVASIIELGIGRGHVTIEDVPSNPAEGSSSAPVPESVSSPTPSCSPQNLQGDLKGSWLGGLLLPLQILVALVALAWVRARDRSRPSLDLPSGGEDAA